jgi:hypothetical protein
LEANQAVSFFIRLEMFYDALSVQSLTLKNGQTKEKFVIKEANKSNDPVTIVRCPIGTNEEEWIEEMSQFSNIHTRKIEFYPKQFF